LNNQGEIHVDSKKGLGTTFTITLPQSPSDVLTSPQKTEPD